jgi:hypothetical protein
MEREVNEIMRTGGYGYIRTREQFGSFEICCTTISKSSADPLGPSTRFCFAFSLSYHVKF